MSNTNILWCRLDLPGHEFARVMIDKKGSELTGTAIFLLKNTPCQLDYIVRTDEKWRTTSARVSGTVREQMLDLQVTVDNARRWYLNGTECPAVEGCIDIDLGFSPSTNLLPIRRLGLAMGEKSQVTAAWLPFPELRFKRLVQSYQRDGEHAYYYECADGNITRNLEVNDAGFVTHYPGLWQLES